MKKQLGKERYFVEKLDLLYEGKAKQVFLTDDPDLLIVDYKDDATAFNGEKKGTIPGKGAVNNRMSNQFFRMLEEKGIGCREIEKIYIGLSHGLQIQGKTGFKEDNKERAVREQKTDTGETEKKKSRIPETKAAEIGEERTDLLTERISPAEIRIEEVILNDKWAQLCQTYPVVHPYEDEREYISIQPKDFVIMTGDYQHLANNSFLLHGFYNYRHLILGREWQGDCFYLGVPGVYYEREKMVARMFGFEAFECSGGRAEAGRFGYYLRKVNI